MKDKASAEEFQQLFKRFRINAHSGIEYAASLLGVSVGSVKRIYYRGGTRQQFSLLRYSLKDEEYGHLLFGVQIQCRKEPPLKAGKPQGAERQLLGQRVGEKLKKRKV